MQLLEIAKIEAVIVNSLQEWLTSVNDRQCLVIAANQTAPIPPYPYVSYTITTPATAKGGTYGIDDNLSRFKTVYQTWSFTVQSDKDTESQELAVMLYSFFDLVGRVELQDNNIIVVRTTDITNRDNMLSIEYEYRNGCDVTFALQLVIPEKDAVRHGYIEKCNPQIEIEE